MIRGMSNLEPILALYDVCALECDGLTRVLHTVLARRREPHVVKVGAITNSLTGCGFAPHWWIELPDGQVVDYRARMWLGPTAPHGIFEPATTRVIYEGEPVEVDVLPDFLFQILTGG